MSLLTIQKKVAIVHVVTMWQFGQEIQWPYHSTKVFRCHGEISFHSHGNFEHISQNRGILNTESNVACTTSGMVIHKYKPLSEVAYCALGKIHNELFFEHWGSYIRHIYDVSIRLYYKWCTLLIRLNRWWFLLAHYYGVSRLRKEWFIVKNELVVLIRDETSRFFDSFTMTDDFEVSR